MWPPSNIPQNLVRIIQASVYFLVDASQKALEGAIQSLLPTDLLQD